MVMGVMSPKELLGLGGPKGWPLEVVKGDPNYQKNPLLFNMSKSPKGITCPIIIL